MSIKQLLAGASLAALVGGVASAQIVGSVDAAGDFDGKTIAVQSDSDLSGDVVLVFDIGEEFDAMGAGGTIDLVLNLTGATFDGAVPDASLVNLGAATNCDFEVDPSLGGGTSGTSVTFSSAAGNQLNQCSADGELTITLPIILDDNRTAPSISASFNATADAGAYTDVPVALDEADDYVQFGDPFTDYFEIAAAAAADGELDDDGDELRGGGAIANQIIGTLDGGDIDGTTTFYLDMTTAITAPEQVGDSGELVLTFPSTLEGITPVRLDGADCTLDLVAGTATCPVADLDTLDNAAALDIDFTFVSSVLESVPGDADALIQPQTPTASFTVTPNAGLGAISGASGNLVALELDDGIDGFDIPADFRWTKVGAGGTESNFRLSGPFSAGTIESVGVQFGNGNDAFPASVTLAPSTDPAVGFRENENVISFTSRSLGDVAGLSGNVNITGITINGDENAFCDNDLNNDGTVVAVGADDTAGDNGCTTNVAVSVAIAGVTNLDGEVTIDRLLINRNELGLSDL